MTVKTGTTATEYSVFKMFLTVNFEFLPRWAGKSLILTTAGAPRFGCCVSTTVLSFHWVSRQLPSLRIPTFFSSICNHLLSPTLSLMPCRLLVYSSQCDGHIFGVVSHVFLPVQVGRSWHLSGYRSLSWPSRNLNNNRKMLSPCEDWGMLGQHLWRMEEGINQGEQLGLG